MTKKTDILEVILLDVAINDVMKHADNKYTYNVGSHHLDITFHQQADMDQFMTTEVYNFLKNYEQPTEYTKFLKFAW